MSNQQSHVTIKTDEGNMTFHDFLIKNKSEACVYDVLYEAVEASSGVIESIENSNQVIIGPSNPITSINPILSMPNVIKALKKVHVTAISPFIGDDAVSGPASKFMKAKGYESNCVGVCQIYKDFLDKYVIHISDKKYKDTIESMNIEVCIDNIVLKTIEDKINLSKKIIK